MYEPVTSRQTRNNKQAGKPQLSIADLKQATAGSAALDLAINKHLHYPKIQCCKISTGVYGPLPSVTVGKVLGRSRLTFQGLALYPRIIVEDFKGEIETMASVKGEMQVNTGDGIAQLLLFPCVKG